MGYQFERVGHLSWDIGSCDGLDFLVVAASNERNKIQVITT